MPFATHSREAQERDGIKKVYITYRSNMGLSFCKVK